MIDSETALQLSAKIDELRADLGVPGDYRLKFNPGPDTFSHEQFIQLKTSILALAQEHDVKLLAYVILHDIATDPDTARRNGINTVCYHFDCALNRTKSPGLVLIDRFNDEGNEIDAHLREKFMIGLKEMPYAKEMRLQRIVGFHYSSIGQSHFPSMTDVVLGSLRFAINAHSRNQEQHLNTANQLLRSIAPMLWREDGNDRVSEIGFLFSPKIIKADKYREKYEGLKNFLAAQGIETEQIITDERTY
ncbi:MAG: hypothetical protein ABJF07_21000 [Nisaea sp.]|uniref:hypothetical protein n=1 Tax=Nisaea sp. TaxID=2024842 RepID=UPI0032662AA3